MPEEFEGLLEMHFEYADSLDLDDIETREVWEEIESQLKRSSRRISPIDNTRTASENLLDEVEMMMADLNEQYGELAALL